MLRISISISVLLLSLQSIFAQVPAYIQASADSILLEKVGPEVIDQIQDYCKGSGPVLANSVWKSCSREERKVNRAEQRMIKEMWENNEIAYYRFEYQLYISDNNLYYFTLDIDTAGHLVSNRPVLLPDCISDSKLCRDFLTEEQARDVARNIRFQLGVRDWDISLSFDEQRQRFFWELRNYSYYKRHYAGCEDAEGEMLKIDCADGTVYSGKTWKVFCTK